MNLKEMESKYLYYLKINTHLRENNLIFCFIAGKSVNIEECEKYFNQLFLKSNNHFQNRKKRIYAVI